MSSSFLLPYSEEVLLRRLESTLASCPSASNPDLKPLRRLKQKLKLRRLQRRRGIPNMDWDKDLQARIEKLNCTGQQDKTGDRPLDRYQLLTASARSREKQEDKAGSMPMSSLSCPSSDLEARIQLVQDLPTQVPFVSPYTGRELRPFIRREFDLLPKKLRLHKELLSHPKVASSSISDCQLLFPVDFCYVRPWHVAPVNALARHFFWPGIDVSESLGYPDFSCVALYRNMVVGFAFLIPDLSHTEAYISFVFTHPDWRRGGIAKFMLYHLIQTCAGRDITLHVSANNPAVMLYQNFGFKVEERVLNFYDKYLPPGSSECKHALFLRLTR